MLWAAIVAAADCLVLNTGVDGYQPYPLGRTAAALQDPSDALQNILRNMSRRLLQSLHHVPALSICCGFGSSSAHAYSTSSFQRLAVHVLRGEQHIQVAATSASRTNQRPSRPWTHLQHAGISSSSSQASAAAAAGEEDSQAGIVSFPLAQTGEGISECELMQWFVKVCPSTAWRNCPRCTVSMYV
jgi:hypothetical protein